MLTIQLRELERDVLITRKVFAEVPPRVNYALNAEGKSLLPILGREPTDEEFANEIGISSAKLSQLETVSIRPASLDAPIGDDDSTEFVL